MTGNSKAPNSELPDDEALAAFAGAAFGGTGRRRRDRNDDEKKKTAAAPTPAGPTVPEEPPAQPADPSSPEPDAAAAADAPARAEQQEEPPTLPKATVPAPASSSEAAAAQGATQGSDDTAGEDAAHAEVAVRAVPAPAVTGRLVPAPFRNDVQVDQVQVPNLGPTGARATQCTIMVGHNVRERFAHYQLSKKMAGDKEPSNALVVRRAFLHCKRNNLFGKLLSDVYQQHNAVDDEDYDEDGMLGEVVGRRAVRGRLKDSGQQSFRPSEQELANYDAFTQAYGFPSRSDFLNAVLDEFLPQLPSPGRRR